MALDIGYVTEANERMCARGRQPHAVLKVVCEAESSLFALLRMN